MSKALIHIVAAATLILVAGCHKSKESRSTAVDRTVDYDPSILGAGPETSKPVMEYPAKYPVVVAGSEDLEPLSDDPSAMVVAYAEPTSGQRTHVVRPRESLYQIARLYYNDHRQWRKIYQANSDRITDPNLIKVGMELLIPQ